MRANMGRAAVLGLFAVFALTTAVVVSGADTDKQPKIVIEEMRHDFGQIYERKVYRHTFTVRNRGTADLVVEHVKPG